MDLMPSAVWLRPVLQPKEQLSSRALSLHCSSEAVRSGRPRVADWRRFDADSWARTFQVQVNLYVMGWDNLSNPTSLCL